jgi:DNA-binding NarL/FixJ family response regulator
LRTVRRSATVSLKMRCLLVDDSPEFLASATRLLESQGFEIVGCASSGAEAVELATTLRPDLALVDIELADEDGIELTHELAQRVPGTRVVLISAYEREDLSDLIGESSAVGFLPKRRLGAAALRLLLSAF